MFKQMQVTRMHVHNDGRIVPCGHVRAALKSSMSLNNTPCHTREHFFSCYGTNLFVASHPFGQNFIAALHLYEQSKWNGRLSDLFDIQYKELSIKYLTVREISHEFVGIKKKPVPFLISNFVQVPRKAASLYEIWYLSHYYYSMILVMLHHL